MVSFVLIVVKDFGIYGYIIGINTKTVTEIFIQGVYVYTKCDSRYMKLPSAALFCQGFCEAVCFSVKFAAALGIEFSVFEMITFFLYYTENKEINIAIWSSCYQVAATGIHNQAICLGLEFHHT
jgi:hypothetical protein